MIQGDEDDNDDNINKFTRTEQNTVINMKD